MAEKQESLIFLVIGIIAIALAVIFYFFLKPGFYKGAAIPLLVIGVIQVGVGFTVYKRSDEDRIRNVYAYGMNPIELKQKELPRMEKVNRNFVIYRWVEGLLALTGVVLVLLFRSEQAGVFWFGLGFTLFIQSLLMLGADYFAEKRAMIYTAELKAFVESFPS